MKEVIVQKPRDCPFREMNEETEEVWCSQKDVDNDKCDSTEFLPQNCPLFQSPIKVMII